MKPLLELIDKGGPAMLAIIALSIVLYSRCFKLLLALRRRARHVRRLTPGRDWRAVQRLQDETREMFYHEKIALGAMIAAAPLLGLLGTVGGMAKTFEGLSAKAGEKSMEALARGISEVLVATESGLLVALPGLLLVYLAHRAALKQVGQLNRFAPRPAGPATP